MAAQKVGWMAEHLVVSMVEWKVGSSVAPRAVVMVAWMAAALG